MGRHVCIVHGTSQLAPGAAISAAERAHCNESVSFTRTAVALARGQKLSDFRVLIVLASLHRDFGKC
jgi:hypothetical protein